MSKKAKTEQPDPHEQEQNEHELNFAIIAKEEIPHIGQIVHFHPNNKERLPAIVVNTFLLEDRTRPAIAANVFYPDGRIKFYPQILPFKQTEQFKTSPNIEDSWSFANEINIQSSPNQEEHETQGINSNLHVKI